MKQAIIQLGQIKRIENVAAVEVRKILTRFKIVAIRRMLRGETSFITQKEIQDLVNVIAKTLMAAEYYGALTIRRLALKASVLDDVVKKMSEESKRKNGLKALQIVTSYTQKINDKLSTATLDIIRQNLSTQAMTQLLSEEFDRLGVSPKNSYQLEGIVRTQTQLAYNAAKYKEEQEPYIQDILWGYRYVTVGDERVRPEHADLDGVTLPKEDPFWDKFYPPNGYSCRCQVIPIFEKVKQVKAPADATVDPDFAFNPGDFL